MKNFLTDLKNKRTTKKAFACVEEGDGKTLMRIINDGFSPLTTRKAVLKDEATGKNYTMSFEETVASKALREEKYDVLRVLFEQCSPELINMSDYINKGNCLEALAQKLTNTQKHQDVMKNLPSLRPQDHDLLFCLAQTYIHQDRFPKTEGLGVVLVQVPYRMPQELKNWLEQAHVAHSLAKEVLQNQDKPSAPLKKM